MTSLPSILPRPDLPPSVPPASDQTEPVVPVKATGAKSSATAADAGGPSLLRKALADGSQSPDLIIRAAAESARALTGADGVAIALRTRGGIVCRARSGELAPPLGSQLSAQSGISGECLRSATIQSCDDASHDARVDPDVCRAMGILSIVAVPLRGAIGIAGILEAFSSRPHVFKDQQIDNLRELALVAEAAYEKERLAFEEETLAKLRPPRLLPTLLARAVGGGQKQKIEIEVPTAETSQEQEEERSGFLPRRYWVLGAATMAVLLVLGVWLSWREPTSEPSNEQPAAATRSAVEPASPSTEPKSSAGVKLKDANGDLNGSSGRNVLKKAAEMERTVDGNSESTSSDSGTAGAGSPPLPSSSSVPSALNSGAVSNPTDNAGTDLPPTITISAVETGNQLSSLISTNTAMPAIDAQLSQGVTPAQLIHKVDPVYPLHARSQRIAGSVDLDITIGEDGLVHSVKQIAGEPILAAAAKDAVRKWRYTPVRLNGKAVQAQKRVTVVFRLP